MLDQGEVWFLAFNSTIPHGGGLPPPYPLHSGLKRSVLRKVVDRQRLDLPEKIVILPHLLHIVNRSNMSKLTFSGIRPSWRKGWSVVELLRMLLFCGTEGLCLMPKGGALLLTELSAKAL